MTNKDRATPSLSSPTRRSLLGLGLAAFGAFVTVQATALSPVAAAQRVPETVQRIADHFSSIRTMTGDFVQFGPRGEQTGGKFYIQRPGKIRFNYESPSAYRVISDGRSVVIDNRKLNTSDLYPLSKTPLKLLLDDRIDLTGSRVRSVKEEGDATTIKLSDRSVFGSATITMVFDPKSYDLRQWTITDAQGKDTTVMIFNVRQDVRIDPSLFRIDYRRNFDVNQRNAKRR
jgi:outer membrane lipoprotein-sorting protein